MRFSTESVPTRKHEAWRYSPVDALDFNSYRDIPENPAPVKLPRQVKDIAGSADAVLVFYNGKYLEAESSRTESVEVMPMREALKTKGAGTLPSMRSHQDLLVLGQWNRSGFRDGYFVNCKPGSKVRTLALVHLYGNQPGGVEQFPFIINTRNILRVEANARLDVFEAHYAINDIAMLINTATDARVESGAQLCMGEAWWFGDQTVFVNDQHVTVARDGQAEVIHFMQGGKLTRNQFTAELTEKGAGVKSFGVYRVSNEQHVETASDIRHLVGETTSQQLYKGLLSHAGRGVFAGRLEIVEKAQKSAASQLTRSLLFGTKAEADAKPQLLVSADDVKAAHGASVGQLNPDELFYLTSRGIDPADAARMIAEGFESEIVERIESEYVKDRMKTVARRSRAGFDMEIAL